MEIVLKNIPVQNNLVKCTCNICNGYGIEGIQNDIGFICDFCMGKGYSLRKLKNNQQVVCEQQTKIYYLVEDNKVKEQIDYFNELKIIKEISKVVLRNSINRGLSDYLDYKLFLKGYLPYLSNEYGCPNEFLNILENNNFNKSCLDCDGINGCLDCEKYSNRQQCWSRFHRENDKVKIYTLK